MTDGAQHFQVGARVLVSDGHDGEVSDWLRGGPGYYGTIVEMTGAMATIELDTELVLESGDDWRYQDFGEGSAKAHGEADTARGRWLVAMQGWVGGRWIGDRTAPLQIGLCPKKPDLNAVPAGGGIGYWVESHAECRLVRGE